MSLRTFGFDPGTKFGWAVFLDGEHEASGVWLTKNKGEHPGLRFERARKELIHLFTKYPPTRTMDPDGGNVRVTSWVGYEDIHVSVFKDKNNLRVYTGLVACMYQAAALAGVHDIRGVTPGQLKKHATGSGKCKGKGTVSKSMMSDACIRTFDVVPDSDDHADAVWCNSYFLNTPWPPPPKPKKLKAKKSSKKKTSSKSGSTSKTSQRRTRSTTKRKSAPAP